MRINIHLYPTADFQFESRILKETGTIARLHIFDRIFLVGYGGPESVKDEALDETRLIWRVPLQRRSWGGKKLRRVWGYLAWARQIILRFRKSKPELINCHSVFDLPIGVILKKLTGGLLVYDAHELETERNGLRRVQKKILKIIEKFAVKRVDHLFLPTPSIAQWYKTQYGLDQVTQIYNAPRRLDVAPSSSRIFREKFQIPESDIIFLYQGAFMNGRSIPLLLSVFSRSDLNRHVVFMGFGYFEELIREYAQKFTNIHFHQAVPSEQLPQYASGGNVGLSIIENRCLSYYYSLPNKLFEYLSSGLPCVVSNFPDMGDLVDTHGCGWKTEVNEAAIYDLLTSISWAEIEEKKANIQSARDLFNWENEERKIIPVYQLLLK